MTDYKTMRVPVDDWKAARDDKRDGETWGEFLQRCRNNPADVERTVETNVEADVDTDELAAKIVDQIGADVGGAKVDDSEIARSVARELDYTALAEEVAAKVVERMR